MLALNGFLISKSTSAQQPTTPLQPTQVVATIPQIYNETFSLQWGGGSLYQLKQRLATMSCIVDTIWVYDNNRWYSYNQYQVPSTLTPNIEFQNNYAQYIPAGTLYASCFDICEFEYIDIQYNGVQRCRTFEDIRPAAAGDLPCTDNFEPTFKEQVFDILPVMPNICTVKGESPNPRSYNWPVFTNNNSYLYVDSYPFVVTTHSKLPPGAQISFLWSESHELCHANQDWQVARFLQPNNPIQTLYHSAWYDTQASKEFIAITGFTRTNSGKWQLPANSVWEDMYNTITPKELSAELCSLYLLEKTGNSSSHYGPHAFTTYLTPAIRQWIETYIVLPS